MRGLSVPVNGCSPRLCPLNRCSVRRPRRAGRFFPCRPRTRPLHNRDAPAPSDPGASVRMGGRVVEGAGLENR